MRAEGKKTLKKSLDLCISKKVNKGDKKVNFGPISEQVIDGVKKTQLDQFTTQHPMCTKGLI